MADFNTWLASTGIGTAGARRIDDDADGSADCVDVPEDWVKFLWPGVPINQILGYGNAKDLFVNSNPEYFDKLPAPVKMQPGDIPVWGATSSNAFGHIAVNISDDGSTATVAEQNTYTQEAVTKAQRSHNNLIGVLRPKGLDMQPANEGDLENIFEAVYALPIVQGDKDYWLSKNLSFKDLFYAVKDSKRYGVEHFINDGDIVNLKAKGIDASAAKGKMWKDGMYNGAAGLGSTNKQAVVDYITKNLN